MPAIHRRLKASCPKPSCYRPPFTAHCEAADFSNAVERLSSKARQPRSPEVWLRVGLEDAERRGFYNMQFVPSAILRLGAVLGLGQIVLTVDLILFVLAVAPFDAVIELRQQQDPRRDVSLHRRGHPDFIIDFFLVVAQRRRSPNRSEHPAADLV